MSLAFLKIMIIQFNFFITCPNTSWDKKLLQWKKTFLYIFTLVLSSQINKCQIVKLMKMIISIQLSPTFQNANNLILIALVHDQII